MADDQARIQTDAMGGDNAAFAQDDGYGAVSNTGIDQTSSTPPTPEKEAAGRLACGVMCAGCMLFPLAMALVLYNEVQAMCANKHIVAAEYYSHSAECSNSKSVEGLFAFISCPIDRTSVEVLTPGHFGMSGLNNSLAFRAAAGSQFLEMYQCIESKQTNNNLIKTEKATKTARDGEYSYDMAWSPVWYDSRTYKREPGIIKSSGCPDFVYNGTVNHNPTFPDRGDGRPVQGGLQAVASTSIKAGAYTISHPNAMSVLTTFSNNSVPISKFAGNFNLSTSTDNIISKVTAHTVTIHPTDPMYLSTCREPRLGCIRISYNSTKVEHVSLFAKVGAAGVTQAQPMDGSWGCGPKEFIQMYPEKLSKQEMIERMIDEKKEATWSKRVAGLLMCWLALICLVYPVAALPGFTRAYVLPGVWKWMSRLFEGLVTLTMMICTCTSGCGCGIAMIAITWITLRPIIGGSLLAVFLLLNCVACCLLYNGNPKFQASRKHGAQTPLVAAAAPVQEPFTAAAPVQEQPYM